MIALEQIPYGSAVADGRVTTPDTMQAIAKRPHVTGHDRHYEAGEGMLLATEGHIVALVDGVAKSVVLERGRIVR